MMISDGARADNLGGMGQLTELALAGLSSDSLQPLFAAFALLLLATALAVSSACCPDNCAAANA
ncbi:hypothetical protein Ciccas_012595 [Cichlidogyrus casuarinus]|uniref:Uncharacterized protein n=1 Tax=Cichlidogyrus casuarinus TaxID=1844966 RepID=A0ABD2PMY1_9PLAT